MSEDERPDLKLLKFEPPTNDEEDSTTADNKWAAKALKSTADQLENIDLEVGSIGIAIAFKNGVTLSTWAGGAYPILLVGALAALQNKVLEEGIKDE